MESPTGGPSASYVIDGHRPVYLELADAGTLRDKVATAVAQLESCRVCPRNCGNNRLKDEAAACHTGRNARVAAAFAHFGEEDCLRGTHGSGTIFFAFCNLRCVFCQNWDISQAAGGHELPADAIADLMLQLQAAGCHNINFVTPEHVAPQVAEAIVAAVPRGLNVPIVYNTSAYDSMESLQLMDGLIDIYMPDFKFWEPATARRLARAQDYPEVARQAVAEMHRQVGALRTDHTGLARRGVLVRHLVMPGQLEETKAIFGWLADEVSPDTYVNIMGQYRPEHRVTGNDRYQDINRRVRRNEMTAAYAAARKAGLWRFDERIRPF
ncbi:MAG: radical SAM protein [Acidimicrobiia bacterium]|nr:radical SAM protein [Acidimicrobiia bacterium]